MFIIVPIDGDDNDTNGNNNDNDHIVISNLEMLYGEMSCFESSFFDIIKHSSDLDNKALFLLDIQYPIDKVDSTSGDADDDTPDDTTNTDPFDNILHNRFRPSIVINDLHDTLTIKEDFDDAIFYECNPIYDNTDSLLDIIANANQFWSTIEGTPSVHDISVLYVDTVDNSNHLNDLTVLCPTKPEYWDGYFSLDDPMLCILSCSVLDDAFCYNITASDIQREMVPVKPHVTQPSLIDFEAQRPFFD